MGADEKRLAGAKVAWLGVALVLAAILLVNPIGYSGGGRDDTRYLDAALCWVASDAVCLPGNHWETRWPAIAPLAAAVGVGGLNRLAVSLGALASYLTALLLVGWLGRLWFTPRTGAIAAALFASAPATAILALRPNVDMVELSAQLGAIGLATLAIRRRSRGHAVAAGISAALALAARDTSLLLAGLGAAAWWLWAPNCRKLLLWAATGFLGVAGAEMVAYWLASGDPLLRFKLALAHGSVPSSELAAWVDTSRSPILNPEFIAGWKRPMGIEIWWPIDPWLNLLANPQIGPWLITAPLAVIAARESIRPQEKRILERIGLGAAVMALAIVYALAIDPKTRAFLLPLAGACIALGWAVSRLLAERRHAFAWTIFGSLLGLGLVAMSQYDNIRPLERAAGDWIRRYPGLIETDAQTRATLILVEGSAQIPLAPAGRPMRMLIQGDECRTALRRSLAAGRIALVDEAGLHDKSSLCLVRYRKD